MCRKAESPSVSQSLRGFREASSKGHSWLVILVPRHFLHDARRFALNNRSTIEIAPLQVYSSALVFSPKSSFIRNQFWPLTPSWIKRPPFVQDAWSPCLQVLENSHQVTALSFCPDGQLVATQPDNKTVQLWDAATGANRHSLEGHSDWVRTVTFSPDGELVASASDDKTVRLWDPATGSNLHILEGHSDRVRAGTFSPDSKLIASASDDNTVRLWDPATGANVRTLAGHSDS